MKLRYKIISGFFILVVLCTGVLAVMLSHDTACPPPVSMASNEDTMQAFVYRCYGSPDVLTLETVEKPVPAENEVLVKIKAAGVNPLDWHYMRGSPYIMRLGTGLGAPDDVRLGVDFAGTVEAVGKNVKKYKPGDDVFGRGTGAFADYLSIAEDRALALKPDNMSFQQAAAVPIAAVTALQALRNKGQLREGQKVLINGASGGVGTFAVQFARLIGAEVTAVCSARNADMVSLIGADHVIDYKTQDYTQSGEKYDLIIDMIGNHSLSDNRQVLTAEGRFVIVGGGHGNWIGPLAGPIKASVYSPFVSQDFVLLMAQMRKDDLETLADLMTAGEITPVIDQTFALHEVPDAIRYSEAGRARGKIVIRMD